MTPMGVSRARQWKSINLTNISNNRPKAHVYIVILFASITHHATLSINDESAGWFAGWHQKSRTKLVEEPFTWCGEKVLNTDITEMYSCSEVRRELNYPGAQPLITADINITSKSFLTVCHNNTLYTPKVCGHLPIMTIRASWTFNSWFISPSAPLSWEDFPLDFGAFLSEFGIIQLQEG